VGDWAFYNGNNNNDFDGSDPAKMIDTDITLTTGGLYNFSITIDPKFKKWNGTVSDGTDTFSRTFMGWRTSNSTVSDYLYFATKSGGSTGSPASDTREWSIDSVAITQLSETPTTILPVVAAHFDGGGSSASPVVDVVDAYTGTSGDGWRSPWKSGTSSAVSTYTVRASGDPDYDEIKPGESGAYLEVETDHNKSGSYAGVTRNYKAFEEGIDWTTEHIIEFTLRIDESQADLDADFTAQNDRYQIGEVNSVRYNVDSNSRWMVACYGGTGSFVNAEDVGVWVFYDGDGLGSSMDAARNVESTVAVLSGGVYDFTITVDPDTKTYVGSVTDGTTEFTTGSLGWRKATDEIGGNLVFSTRSDSADDVRAFSLDEVLLIPEPGTLILLGIGLAMLAAMRRARR